MYTSLECFIVFLAKVLAEENKCPINMNIIGKYTPLSKDEYVIKGNFPEEILDGVKGMVDFDTKFFDDNNYEVMSFRAVFFDTSKIEEPFEYFFRRKFKTELFLEVLDKTEQLDLLKDKIIMAIETLIYDKKSLYFTDDDYDELISMIFNPEKVNKKLLN